MVEIFEDPTPLNSHFQLLHFSQSSKKKMLKSNKSTKSIKMLIETQAIM